MFRSVLTEWLLWFVSPLLRPFWRRWLRLRRLAKHYSKLGAVEFFRVLFIDFLLNPIARGGRCNWLVQLKIRDYAGPFLLRLGTSDFDCLLEVLLEEEYATALGLAGQARLILDAGANVGYSIRCFQRAFRGCKIIAIEPDAQNLEVCRRNVALGQGGQVIFLPCCLSSQSGSVLLDRSGGAWGIRMVDVCVGVPEGVMAKTVEQVLLEAGVAAEPIDLFKCDIEGAESRIFPAGGSWIRQVRVFAVEVHGLFWATTLVDHLREADPSLKFAIEDQLVFAHRETGRAVASSS